jgi:hypothetical protein
VLTRLLYIVGRSEEIQDDSSVRHLTTRRRGTRLVHPGVPFHVARFGNTGQDQDAGQIRRERLRKDRPVVGDARRSGREVEPDGSRGGHGETGRSQSQLGVVVNVLLLNWTKFAPADHARKRRRDYGRGERRLVLT